MEWDYQIEVEVQRVFIRVRGRLDHAGLREMSREIRRDPSFDVEFAQLVDISQADASAVRASTVWTFAGRACGGQGEALRALVAPSDLEYGMARMWELATQQKTGLVGVFRDLNDAELWLREESLRQDWADPLTTEARVEWP